MARNALILEDDTATGLFFADALATQNQFTVSVAQTLSEAQSIVGREPLDLALCDLQLPDGFSFDLIKALATLNPHCRILVLTKLLNTDLVVTALIAGAHGYLVKTDGTKLILRYISELLEGETPMSNQATTLLIENLQRQARPLALAKKNELLTDREAQLLTLLEKGQTYQAIADQLFISKGTVQSHIKNIYRKLDVHNKEKAIERAFYDHD
jgi:DNA-binding NarL/FixJ family response regulator